MARTLEKKRCGNPHCQKIVNVPGDRETVIQGKKVVFCSDRCAIVTHELAADEIRYHEMGTRGNFYYNLLQVK